MSLCKIVADFCFLGYTLENIEEGKMPGKKENDNLDRCVAMVPNGIRLGLNSEDEMVTIDFLGILDPNGMPKEIIGSYAFSFKRALAFAEQIKESVKHAK